MFLEGLRQKELHYQLILACLGVWHLSVQSRFFRSHQQLSSSLLTWNHGMDESIYFILFYCLIQGLIAQTDLELTIQICYLYVVLPQSPQCWDSRNEAALLNSNSIFSPVWVEEGLIQSISSKQ